MTLTWQADPALTQRLHPSLRATAVAVPSEPDIPWTKPMLEGLFGDLNVACRVLTHGIQDARQPTQPITQMEREYVSA